MDEMTWVAPRLVAQIRFVEWTADAHLRHAALLGVRDDKDPRRVDRRA
jgi:bifunctional non-homologous end joining protein LigD